MVSHTQIYQGNSDEAFVRPLKLLSYTMVSTAPI